MLLKYYYDEHLAQASYLVGCVATGEALVVDPMRHIAPYLETAANEGVRITHITETHIHADFVSGSRELAAHTGATMYLSDMGDADWKYGYADQPNVLLVRAGDSWMVGNVRVEVVASAGHTPEHIAFLITDTAAADHPIGMFTGDFLFVGDIGRPDLLEEAAGLRDTAEPGARRQFQSVETVRRLPDYLQIWPAHGAGSACGKALGAIPSTTLGYEKLVNPAFQFEAENSFVHWLLADQPEAPRYFARMKHVNKVGPALLSELPTPPQLGLAGLTAALESGALVADLRPADAFVRTHVPGTLSVPAENKTYSTYIGWFVDYNAPFYFIAPDASQVDAILIALRAIGIDNVGGYFLPDVVAAYPEAASLPVVTARDIAEQPLTPAPLILDVRGKTEYQAGHVAGALHIPLGFLPRRLDRLPRDRPVVAQCTSGYRSQIAASLLRRAGFDNAQLLGDDEHTWSALLPVEQGQPT